MSYSFGPIYRTATSTLSTQAEALGRIQEQIATGSRILRTSDDPSDAHRIIAITQETNRIDSYVSEVEDTITRLDNSLSVLQSVSEQITSITGDLTMVLSSGTSARKGVAAGIDDAIRSLIYLANTDQEGQYFFGGDSSASKPYAIEEQNGQITRVVYQGSQRQRNAEIAPGVDIPVTLIGDDVFRANNELDTVMFGGSTGAALGTGTSSVTGDVKLDVTNDGTNYKLSIDGGLTTVTVPIGGEANTAVTDSRTGQVLYVDTTGLTDTGTEKISVNGTHDIFNLLINLRDLLNSDEDVQDQLTNATVALESVHEKITQGFATIGSRSITLETVKDSFENIKVNSQEEVSRLEEADIAQLAIDLTRREILYEMSLSVSGKLLSMNLLDFIR